jgi:NHLM bacteriocin system ABC transporter ATP-binding protein
MGDQVSQASPESPWLSGRVIEVGGNFNPPIDDPEKVWIILSGLVDLFMVRMRDGEPAGVRSHIARMRDGQAFFYLNTAAFCPGWGIVASAAPGTRLAETNRSSLRFAASSPNHAAVIHALLESWISTLSLCAGGEVEPKTYSLLEAGKTIQVPREPRPLLSHDAVLWVQHREGVGQFLGNPKLPSVNGDSYFPITSPGWLQEQPGNRLDVFTTAQALGEDREWLSVEVFHRTALASLQLDLEGAEEKERTRLELKRKAEETRVHISLRQLALPLRRKSEKELLIDADDPLFGACLAIGEAQGIEFKPAPEMIRHLPLRDPVAAIARASGIRFRRVILDENWWTREGPPLLAFHESDRRPFALLPKRGGGYRAFDPVDRSHVSVKQQFGATLEPFAYTFYRAFPPRAVKVTELFTFGLRGAGRDVFLVLAMGILSGLLGMATPILTGTIFDSIIPGAQRSRLLEMAVFLGSASLASVMFGLTRGFAVLRLEGKMEAIVQAAVWDRLLSLPVPFFRQFSAGDLAMRGLAVTQMRQILTGSAMSSIFSGIFSIFNFCLLFYYSPRMAILATALILVALIFTLVCSWFQIKGQREITELRGRITGMVLQFIMGISKFRISGTENRAFVSWATPFAREKLVSLKARKVSNWLTVFNSVFPTLSGIAIFYMMAYLMSKPGATPLTTGEFLAFNSAYGQFASNMLQLTSVFISLLAIVPIYERAKPILESLPEVDPSKANAGELTGHIEISHIVFRYKEDGPLVLKDISVNIQPGEFVAFVGPSGSGKSTIFRMLLGFEKPESGAVYFDGQELSSLDIQSVRQQMGVVMQNSTMFSGDIYSNIVCSAPYTIDEAWEAARLAGLERDLQDMPMGMHTIIGDGGAGLSGGQRQRLMIARAIVGKPRILLFDEATSALDNQTQAIVSRSLEGLKSTRVVIAHRLSTVINADRIFVVQNGELLQSGTYAELMEQKGTFRELASRQLA